MFYHLLVHSSRLKIKTQVNLDNCLIHKTDGFCIHHWNHSHLHPLHKVHQLCKNPYLQQLQNNSNLHVHQIHMNLNNCLIHIWDLLDIVHHWYSSLRLLNKNGNHSTQLFHYLHLHNRLKIIIKCMSWCTIFILILSNYHNGS